jgi:hypothetical protein
MSQLDNVLNKNVLNKNALNKNVSNKNIEQTNILANMIRFIHILLIVCVILIPFQSDPYIISANISIIIFILYGWIMTQCDPMIDENGKKYGYKFGKCYLTQLECDIRGIEYKDGFIFQLIKPLKKIDDQFDEIIVCFMIFWLIINIYRYFALI